MMISHRVARSLHRSIDASKASCVGFCRGVSATSSVEQSQSRRRRVVVTGMGLVSPLGVGTEQVWDSLCKGACGIQALKEPEYEKFAVRIAGQVPRAKSQDNWEGDPSVKPFCLEEWVDKADRRLQGHDYIAFAIAAAAQALEASGALKSSSFDPTRAGVAIGTGMPNIAGIADAALQIDKGKERRVSPFFIPSMLVNMPAGQVSMKYGLKGPNHAVSTACATGAHSIGDAFRLIQHDDADMMVCGGTEASIHPITVVGFNRARALATNYNDDPQRGSRPFDADRDGFVIGEGSAILVLEERERAIARGAPILAEVSGYGLSGDAYHVTTPSPDGDGPRRCIRATMKEAGWEGRQVDYVNAHATGTEVGDAGEMKAIASEVGEAAGRSSDHTPCFVSSTKGATGHLLGAAGAIEAAFSILSVQHGMVPPTLNLDRPDPEPMAGISLVAHNAQPHPVRRALSNSFGFGGTNCGLAVEKHE